MQFVVINVTHNLIRLSDSEPNMLEFIDRKDNVKGYYTNRDAAVAAAQQAAKAKPTQQFAVMEVAAIFETTTPKVIAKKYNASGELVLDKEAV